MKHFRVLREPNQTRFCTPWGELKLVRQYEQPFDIWGRPRQELGFQ